MHAKVRASPFDLTDLFGRLGLYILQGLMDPEDVEKKTYFVFEKSFRLLLGLRIK